MRIGALEEWEWSGGAGVADSRGFAVVVLVLSACAGGPEPVEPVEISDMAPAELLNGSRAELQAGNHERARRMAEELLERTQLDPETTQEALYLAGVARLDGEERKRAFRHFETLMEDYPYSVFLPEVEKHVYQIGLHYLSQEPSWFFKDLFSGRPFGVEILRQFNIAFPYSDLADDALAGIAEYHFGREEFDFAADKYEMLTQRYPRSEWADLARYRVGLCYLRHSRGIGYDPTPADTARQRFQDYLTNPGEHREHAEQGMAQAEEILAQTELEVARFYLLREQDRGARIHFANVVLAYPRTNAAEIARTELETRGWDVSLNSLDTLGGGTRR